jgi:hypothetical protein
MPACVPVRTCPKEPVALASASMPTSPALAAYRSAVVLMAAPVVSALAGAQIARPASKRGPAALTVDRALFLLDLVVTRGRLRHSPGLGAAVARRLLPRANCEPDSDCSYIFADRDHSCLHSGLLRKPNVWRLMSWPRARLPFPPQRCLAQRCITSSRPACDFAFRRKAGRALPRHSRLPPFKRTGLEAHSFVTTLPCPIDNAPLRLRGNSAVVPT